MQKCSKLRLRAEENLELEAIRALQYEGTPLENAQNFKDQGNEMVRLKRWGDGKEFYTKAIGVLRKAGNNGENGPKELQLEGVCHVNRALCHLELSRLNESLTILFIRLTGIENYRSTILDCAQTLRHDSRNIKAFYRSSLALLALDKIEQALDACSHGLAVEVANVPLQHLSTRIQARRVALVKVEEERRQRVLADRKSQTDLASALKARNIRVRTSQQAPDLEDTKIHLEAEATHTSTTTSTLHFPLLLLYPLHAQSDFIKSFPETDTITQHLDYILPLPWDQGHEYSIDSAELYMETISKGLVKVGKKMSLSRVLGNDQVEVVDQVVRINVVPKSKASGWIAEMKARQGK